MDIATIFIILIIIFWLIGFIWLGITIGHPVLVPLGGVVLFVVFCLLAVKHEDIGIVLLCIVPVATIVAFILTIIHAVKEKKEEKVCQQKQSELLNAVKTGDVKNAEMAIIKGAEVDSYYLRIAIENHNKEMVILLIEHGANVNSEYDGKTVLDYTKDDEIINILKEHGAKTKAELESEAIELFNLGLRYDNGEGMPRNPEKAVELYEKAVALGCVPAMNNLGVCYQKGDGVAKNEYKGNELIEEAAELGYAPAQFNLFCTLYNSESYSIAFEWCEKSAKQGWVPAQYELGLCYYEGKGTGIDYKKAGKWFKDAAEKGHEEARAKLDELHQRGLY